MKSTSAVNKYRVTSANETLLRDYVLALYGVVVSSAKDNKVSKEFRQLMLSIVQNAAKFEDEVGITVPLFQPNKDFDATHLVAHGKAIRKALRTVIVPDASIEHDYIDQIKAAATWMVNNSDQAYNKLAKLAPSLNQPLILEGMKSNSVDQKKFARPLMKIVKFYTGRPNDPNLSTDERIKLKESNLEVFREFMRMRKEFNMTWRNQLRNMVVDAKKPLIDYKSAIDTLNGLQMEHTMPVGFDGLVDQNGKLYTHAGKSIKGLPGYGFSIKMNPAYDAKKDDQYVFTTIETESGRTAGHVYTEDYNSKARKVKFEKVANLTEQVAKARGQWMTWVKKPDSKDPRVAASTILEVLFQFSARIGSLGNAAKGESTFGIGTLQVKHVFPQGNGGLNLIYKGKDGVRQVHKLQPKSNEAKLMIRHITEQMEGKGPTDRLWTYDWNGSTRPMTGQLVNKWFKRSGASVTVHKLRHAKATELFKDLLAENKAKIFEAKTPLTQVQADTMLKELATKVGAILGHVRGVGEGQKVTGGTALAAYIDPNVQLDYYRRLNLRPPRMIEKFAKDNKE